MAAARIQLCGRFALELDGTRIEDALPGRQGRAVWAYLVVNRARAVDRARLADVLWPRGAPAGAETTIRGLVFRLRKVVGEERLSGRSELRLSLPADAWIDVEAARTAIHTAESSIALGRFKEAWLPARIAASIPEDGFMDGHEGEWFDEQRRELEDVRLRGLECIAAAGLRLGGPELDAAERAGKALIKAAPYRESGYRFLIEVLERQGNVAEALRVYDRIRRLLRDELGIAPSAELTAAHGRLVGAGQGHEEGPPGGGGPS